jgi:hypothetical protein
VAQRALTWASSANGRDPIQRVKVVETEPEFPQIDSSVRDIESATEILRLADLWINWFRSAKGEKDKTGFPITKIYTKAGMGPWLSKLNEDLMALGESHQSLAAQCNSLYYMIRNFTRKTVEWVLYKLAQNLSASGGFSTRNGQVPLVFILNN